MSSASALLSLRNSSESESDIEDVEDVDSSFESSSRRPPKRDAVSKNAASSEPTASSNAAATARGTPNTACDVTHDTVANATVCANSAKPKPR